ncbi:hypothetical protein [Sphingomonas sp. BAUL-RG-20F-R05-02]|uniref:hypothetical protein n=1 Tax=Sphingomonas sp. BAUL-RG-20F-R05-02 TaxID=2914830 RepID=UPI001F5866E8|nr:hypothetical protein [Sphingomonas sp. BAUL-RG-20F-R05-02]
MNRVLLLLFSMTGGGLAATPAVAQQSDKAVSVASIGGYDNDGLTSPSSATSSVSPSSVPQAVTRLNGEENTAELSLGTSFAAGDFGSKSDTTILTSALGARLRLGNWGLTASLPWMRIQSRSTVFTGIDATPVLVAPNTASRRKVYSGLGDLTLGGSFTFIPKDSNVELQFSGRAKLSTASKISGLSSGENDYSLGADISVPVGKVTPFASFSYRFLGDTTTYVLRNGPAASAGASYALSNKSFLLLSYHYSLSATRLVSNSHEVFVGASTKVRGSPLRLTGYATAGLSSGAAAASGGLALSIDLQDGFGKR